MIYMGMHLYHSLYSPDIKGSKGHKRVECELYIAMYLSVDRSDRLPTDDYRCSIVDAMLWCIVESRMPYLAY